MMAGELGAGERDRLVVRVASLESEAATEVADARQSGGERKVEPWCTVEGARSFFWFTLLLLVSGVALRSVDDAQFDSTWRDVWLPKSEAAELAFKLRAQVPVLHCRRHAGDLTASPCGLDIVILVPFPTRAVVAVFAS